MKVILVVLLATFTYVYGQCQYDYECGNMPYRFCTGGADDCSTTLDGIAVEGGFVYYAQVCRTLDILSNITFKRVPIAGGVPEDITTRQQIPAPVNPQRILGVLGDFIFYDIVLRQPGRGLRSFNIETDVENIIQPVSLLPQSFFDYDVEDSDTYFCNYNIENGVTNYTIERQDQIVTEGNLVSDATLYVFPLAHSCGPLRRNAASDIFFVDYVYDYSTPIPTIHSNIYRGTTTCANCTLPAPFYTIAEQIEDMDISGDYLVYGTSTGLYRIRLDGSETTTLSALSVSGVQAVGSTIYFNTGNGISSVDITGANTRQLNAAPTGSCVCRPVFTGDRCQTCNNGQVQWNYNGQPNCVPLDGNGNPETCMQDYQCNNPPYTVCFGTCQCRQNFTGTGCDQCAYQVTWNEYGFPQCQ